MDPKIEDWYFFPEPETKYAITVTKELCQLAESENVWNMGDI